MNNNVMIITTISLDCDAQQTMQVLHLVSGDYGTRKLRFIPTMSGRLLDMDEMGVTRAKMRLHCDGWEDLLIDCELDEAKKFADLVPTQAMVDEADEWAAQLVLLDDNNQTMSSADFRIVVHGTVYQGDAIEHTNSSVLAAYYDAQGHLNIEKRNGDVVRSTGESNLVGMIEEELSEELVSAEDRQALEGLSENIDQAVKTTSSPTFAGLTIGTLTIDANGNVTGARFT